MTRTSRRSDTDLKPFDVDLCVHSLCVQFVSMVECSWKREEHQARKRGGES